MVKLSSEPIDLIILAGFLGSGKTTLLIDYLNSDSTRDTGVIVNEVGEIGIDGITVASSTDKVPMTVMPNGCVCCTLRSSLVDTIHYILDIPRLAGEPRLKRIVLETSGLSKPGPILASLADPSLGQRGIRAIVVTLYDCITNYTKTEQYREAAAQFAAAQRIILNKVDLISPDQIQELKKQVQKLNPFAEMITEQDREQVIAKAFINLPYVDSVKQMQQISENMLPPTEHSHMHVLTATLTGMFVWNEFTQWIDNIAAFCGERLLRFKAIVPAPEHLGFISIQSVGTTFSRASRLPDSVNANKDFSAIIIITQGIDAQTLKATVPYTGVHFKCTDPIKEGEGLRSPSF